MRKENICQIVLKSTWSLLSAILALFVDSAETNSSNSVSENAARGGVLNYRTGKLDDGTDPIGWYDN